ncbi:MAG: hypothetical protein ACJ76J_18625 [Thermoanaerobaculia bacterium]
MIAELEPPPSAVPESPYKLLDYFGDSEEDQLRFGGREREVQELVAHITNERTLVLYGPSGIGKTSLLLAGVFPVLRDRGYLTVYARTLGTPLDDLRKAIADGCKLGAPSPDEDLRALVERATRGGPVVVMLDQFEEFFIRFKDRPEDRAAFIAELAVVLRDPSSCLTVVFSLREDYLAFLDEFNPKLPEPLADRRYRLQPMTAFGARQAIAKPLVRAGIEYEPAVISRVVSQLEGVGFEPMLLQILCSELYREAVRRAGGGRPRIAVEDLEQLGGLEGIFRRYLNGVVEAIPKERHLLTRMVLDALISSESTRRAATLEDLRHARFNAGEREMQEILDLLTGRILRCQRRDGQAWYELIHERLIPVLRPWLDLDEEFYVFRKARDFVLINCEGELWRRSPETLLNEEVLVNLLGPRRERFRFEERELEFVLCSALYRCPGNALFWAQRYGMDKAVDLVERLAVSGSEEERRGAMTLAGELKGAEARLAGLCRRLAFEDLSEPVRRAAAVSLGKVAQDEDLDGLRAALARSTTHKRADEVLAGMLAGGHPLKSFGWQVRFQSRRRDRKRRLQEHRETLLARRLIGLGTGGLAAPAWLVLLFPLVVLFKPDAPPSEVQGVQGLLAQVTTYGACVGAAALILLPFLGGLMGTLAANAGARHAALHGEGRWLGALFGSFGVGCGALLPGVLLAVASLWESNNSSWGSLLETAAVLAFAALVHGIVALLVQFSRPCVWPGTNGVQAWFWSLLAGLGLPLLPLALILVLQPFAPGDGALAALTAASLIVSFATTVALVALARSAARHPLGEPPEISRAARWRSRAVVVAIVLLVLALGALGSLSL